MARKKREPTPENPTGAGHPEEITREECDRLGEALLDWASYDNPGNRHIKRFYHEYTVHAYNWFCELFNRDDPRITFLKKAHERAMEMCEVKKMDGAQVGLYKEKTVIWDLMNNHGQAEKRETSTTSKVVEVQFPPKEK